MNTISSDVKLNTAQVNAVQSDVKMLDKQLNLVNSTVSDVKREADSFSQNMSSIIQTITHKQTEERMEQTNKLQLLESTSLRKT